MKMKIKNRYLFLSIVDIISNIRASISQINPFNDEKIFANRFA